MPKPKNFTRKQTEKRDEIADRLKAEGKPESNSFAIATAAVKKSKKKKGGK